MKSPLTIGYNDLILEQERLLVYMEHDYPGKVLAGAMNSQTATKRMECCKVLIRLLKKHKKDRQLNLEDAFREIKKKSFADDRGTAGDDPDFYLECP